MPPSRILHGTDTYRWRCDHCGCVRSGVLAERAVGRDRRVTQRCSGLARPRAAAGGRPGTGIGLPGHGGHAREPIATTPLVSSAPSRNGRPSCAATGVTWSVPRWPVWSRSGSARVPGWRGPAATPFHRAARRRLPAAFGRSRRFSPAARRGGAVVKLLRRCVHELWALFIDDGALATVGWIVLACLTLRQVPVGVWSGPILFAGLSAIFLLTIRAKP